MRWHPFCGIFAEDTLLFGEIYSRTKEQFSNVVSRHPDPLAFVIISETPPRTTSSSKRQCIKDGKVII